MLHNVHIPITFSLIHLGYWKKLVLVQLVVFATSGPLYLQKNNLGLMNPTLKLDCIEQWSPRKNSTT